MESVVEFMFIWRGMLVVMNVSKRRWWKSEFLVNGSVIKRVLYIVKILCLLSNFLLDEIDVIL